MKKTILSLATAIVFSFAGQVFAGAGHSHSVSEPISKAQASQQAATVKQQLVRSEQVSSEWSGIKGGRPQQRTTSATYYLSRQPVGGGVRQPQGCR